MTESALLLLLLGLLLGLVAGFAIAQLLQRRALREQAQHAARTEEALRDAFAGAAQSALRANSDQFLQLARESFGREQAGAQSSLRELVQPIRAALEKTEQQVGQMERERRDAFTSLRTQLEMLATDHVSLQRETRNLVTALRRPEVRGRWGEITLKRVVELAGLSEHCDFTEQPSVETGQGIQRPDLIVHMPDARELVVDAKTPLDAYLEAIDADNDETRRAALQRHAGQLEARVRELGSKAYWNQFERSPDFAVLFLPGDQFLSAALAERPELLDNALRMSVIIATPSTLIALLKAVAFGWRQTRVAENAALIRDLGQQLHQRIGTFVNHLAKVGKGLSGAVDGYNAAVGSLERQVLPCARRFTELGAATGDALPTLDPLDLLARRPASATEDSPALDSEPHA